MNNYFYHSTSNNYKQEHILFQKYPGAIPLRIDSRDTFYNVLSEGHLLRAFYFLISNITEEDLLIFNLLGLTLIKLSDDAHIYNEEYSALQFHMYYKISYFDIVDKL